MQIQGHAWNGPTAVLPRLLTAVVRHAPRPAGVFHFTNTHWVLDYAVERNGWVRAGSLRATWHPRLAHSAHLYPPGTPYWEDTTRDASSTLRSAFILFEGGESAALSRLVQRPFGYARFTDSTCALQELLKRAAQIGQERGDAGFWQAQSLFCQVLDLLVQARHQEGNLFSLADLAQILRPSFVTQVDEYLREHLSERVTLAAVARHFHVSLSTLAHRYNAEAGQSPWARLIELRINVARGLLLGGQRLDLVAAQTGFCDAYHLSKTFKHRLGLSPRAFLKEARTHVKSSTI